MSGIEVAGLVLGAFPILVTALEHSEAGKTARAFWHIRRQYQLDLGSLRDCELGFRLNLKDLLSPLLADRTITKAQYESLLADSSDRGWAAPEIEAALSDRLSDAKDRCVAILRKMEETIVQLAIALKVDDGRFQAALGRKIWTDPSNRQALLAAANDHLLFQINRIKYSLTVSKRQDLIKTFKEYNANFEGYLLKSDRIAQRLDPTDAAPRKAQRNYSFHLSFWSHADCMFRLTKEAWTCPCASHHCAQVWLQAYGLSACDAVGLELLLKSSGGQLKQQVQHGAWQDQVVHIQLREEPQSTPTSSAVHLPNASLSGLSSVHAQMAMMSLGASAPAFVKATPARAPDARTTGLCTLIQAAGGQQTPRQDQVIGTLTESCANPRTYEVHVPNVGSVDWDSISLREFLSRGKLDNVRRKERWTLAYVLATSFLKLYPTPWLPLASAQNVFLPVNRAEQKVLAHNPYTLASFDSSAGQVPQNSAFVDLGILLMELCFNCLIESTPEWKQHPDPWHPSNRTGLAGEWAKEVPLHADMNYADAVNWCLHRANVRSQDWRLEFAQFVVQPLQQCHNAVVAATA